MANIEKSPEAAKARRKEILERVKARLDELGRKHKDLGDALGYDKDGYQAFYKLFVSGRKKMTPELRQRAATFLQWPLDMLIDPEVDDERTRRFERAYSEFLRDGGNEVPEHILRTIKSMKFFGSKVPGVDGLKMLALTLETIIGERDRNQLAESIRLHAELENVPEPPRPRPRGPRNTR